MNISDIISIVLAAVSVCVSAIGIYIAKKVGDGQIRIAKSVEDFEKNQDERDEERRNEYIYAEATKFIQKYNCFNYESDIYLLPLCAVAYKYDPIFPYKREIYRDFCSLREEVQNEILNRCELDIMTQKCNDYYYKMFDKMMNIIKNNYHDDYVDRIFNERGKYFKKALTLHGTETITGIMEFEKLEGRITDLLAYHKDDNPFKTLFELFQNCEEFIASYICCQIAKYTIIYCCKEKEINLGYVCSYRGEIYMEDLFLEALLTVEYRD